MWPPPLAAQLKVAPEVVEEPLSVTEVVVQVSTLSAPASAFGGVITVTILLSVLQQEPPGHAPVVVQADKPIVRFPPASAVKVMELVPWPLVIVPPVTVQV